MWERWVNNHLLMRNNPQPIIKEYRSKLSLYEQYCVAVCNLLESLLRKGDYKYQLSYRINNIDSLREKILRKANSRVKYRQLSDIEDILGIRVVFYTEIDRKNFKKRLSAELRGGVHYNEMYRTSGYRSTHAIISFGNDRTNLPEYRKFKGLKCEVQLTLILNHAWAEVEHDILYKESSRVRHLDKRRYDILRQRME